MQPNRTCPHCGADTDDDSTPGPDMVGASVREFGVTLGPPVVERQGRDCLGWPLSVAGIDDVDTPAVDK